MHDTRTINASEVMHSSSLRRLTIIMLLWVEEADAAALEYQLLPE